LGTCLWVLLARELEEGRRRDQATIAVREAPTLGPEVEDRAAPRTRGRAAEIHRDKFDEIARRAHHRRHVVDLDVVGLRQIDFAFLRRDADLQHLHHLAVFSPSHVLFVVVAHRQTRDLADPMILTYESTESLMFDKEAAMSRLAAPVSLCR
jgi:hypothetical protein